MMSKLHKSTSDLKLPMVEVFETIEGEGSAAGYPTVFVRSFHCNIRCTWCDTPYSYAPDKPEFEATIAEIIDRIKQFSSRRICFTGGEPLIHAEKSAALLAAMAELDHIVDIHVETNGAVDIAPFVKLGEVHPEVKRKVRFIMDFKLPSSGEMGKMVTDNFRFLQEKDEIKFVIADDADFQTAVNVIESYYEQGQLLFSPVWETMPPHILTEKILAQRLSDVRVSLQLHKMIWDPDKRGV